VTTLSSSTGTKPIGSPLLSVQGGGKLTLFLDLGNLSPGKYSVTFYVEDNASHVEVSQPVTIAFNV